MVRAQPANDETHPRWRTAQSKSSNASAAASSGQRSGGVNWILRKKEGSTGDGGARGADLPQEDRACRTATPVQGPVNPTC